MAALERLHYLLSMATSQNPDNIKEAETGLSQLETQPRFHIALLVRKYFQPASYLFSNVWKIILFIFSLLSGTDQSTQVSVYNQYFTSKMELKNTGGSMLQSKSISLLIRRNLLFSIVKEVIMKKTWFSALFKIQRRKKFDVAYCKVSQSHLSQSLFRLLWQSAE